MSYDVSLCDGSSKPVKVERFVEGGTYPVEGSIAAELNITGNYAQVYDLVDFSINDLDGKSAGDTADKLREVVGRLGIRKFPDYWAPTPGNAGHAASILLAWAEQYPDATWRVE